MVMCRIAAFFGVLALVAVSCQPEPSPRRYLFLGHPYSWAGTGEQVDERVKSLPLEQYQQIWLGGDVCSKLTRRPETLVSLDSLFRFGRQNVHWAFGNHDVKWGNEEWIHEVTGRPEYYAEWIDGILLVVLNTNLLQWPLAKTPPSFCERMEGQFDLIRAVADTVRHASHVVILHHYCLLTNELADHRFDLDTIFNYYKPFLKVRCAAENASFEKAVYPLLVGIRERGIEVVLAGGDFGQRAKAFAYQTKEGIWFLGSGINNSVNPAYAPSYVTSFDPDQVLLFSHDPDRKTLDWEFLDLDSLAGAGLE